MKYALDQIIDGICVLENLENKKILEVKLEELPRGVKEGNILIYKDGKYEIDHSTEEERRKSFRERLERLKGIKK